MAKETRISIRIASDTKREIEDAAALHCRTVSNYLLWIERTYREAAQSKPSGMLSLENEGRFSQPQAQR